MDLLRELGPIPAIGNELGAMLPLPDDAIGLAHMVQAMAHLPGVGPAPNPMAALQLGQIPGGFLQQAQMHPLATAGQAFLPTQIPGLPDIGTMPPAMLVYHGTPHTFPPTPRNPLGEFDLSKIGTGEGAQAYGHGIYLAERPGVGREYQNRLSGTSATQTFSWGGQKFSGPTPEKHALSLAYYDGVTTARRIGREGLAAANSGEQWAMEMGGPQYWDKMLKTANAIKSKSSIGLERGNLYRVDLPDEHIARMLDWDAPLREQPGVTSMMRNIGDSPADIASAIAMYEPRTGLPGIRGEMARSELSKLQSYLNLSNARTGQEFYGMLANRYGGPPGASQLLGQSGIPGLKYFDQGSRAAGQGTRNFVVWNPEILRILGVE